MKRLSQKEKNEPVTKAFLVKNGYLTEKRAEEILDKKAWEILDYYQKDMKQHIEMLMEHQLDQLQTLMEQMDERYVLRREWRISR